MRKILEKYVDLPSDTTYTKKYRAIKWFVALGMIMNNEQNEWKMLVECLEGVELKPGVST